MPKSPGSGRNARPQSGVFGTVTVHLQVRWQEQGEQGVRVDVSFPLKGESGGRVGAVLLPPPPVVSPR